MKRELQTVIFTSRYSALVEYMKFIDKNPYIEIVSVINDETSVVVTYYE